MNLNDMAAQIHEISKSKGFWPPQGRDPAEVLMLIVTEVAEAMEDIRDGKALDHMVLERPGGKPAGVPSELADVIIRVLDACAAWGVDIESAVAQKVRYNQARPAMHGRVR